MYAQSVTIADSWGSQALGTLPANMRPPHPVRQPVNVPHASLQGTATSTDVRARAQPDGWRSTTHPKSWDTEGYGTTNEALNTQLLTVAPLWGLT